MRSITNLAWPHTPFGAGQRPFGRKRPLLAAFAVGWQAPDHPGGEGSQGPSWACVVYLPISSTQTLCLDGQPPRFGYELLLSTESGHDEQHANTSPVPSPRSRSVSASLDGTLRRIDAVLVTCRRRAKILAGHGLHPHLERLTRLHEQSGAVEHLPGIGSVSQIWTNRAHTPRAVAVMLDTAHDRPAADTPAARPAPGRPGLYATAERDPGDPGDRLTEACLNADLRIDQPVAPAGAPSPAQAIGRTLAIGLLAARYTGRYRWERPMDIGLLVEEAAWDQLDQATTVTPGADTPPASAAPTGSS